MTTMSRGELAAGLLLRAIVIQLWGDDRPIFGGRGPFVQTPSEFTLEQALRAARGQPVAFVYFDTKGQML